MPVLNPTLHERLERKLGSVRVSNPGFEASKSYFPVVVAGKRRLGLHVDYWGEAYNANCIFCGDTRRRMCVSYLWGTRDPRTRDDCLHLAYCHNEGCLSTRERQKQLHVLLFPEGRYAGDVQVPVIAKPMLSLSPPGTFTLPDSAPLDELDPHHPACRYLLRRGFDPLRLYQERDVRYADLCSSSAPRFFDPRLIVPVHAPPLPSLRSSNMRPRLVGWQARSIATDNDLPKYLTATGMRKSQILYGLPTALQTSGPVVLVEGVIDAWKVGLNAVATFGKCVSQSQADLILQHFRGRPLAVWLDPDARSEAEELASAVRRARIANCDPACVVIVDTPPGRDDAGDCTHEECVAVIAAALDMG